MGLAATRVFSDVFLHALGAVLPHLFRGVSVDIQHKRCGSMAHRLLHGLDVVSVLQAGRSKAVPEVVEPRGIKANAGHNTLEVLVDRVDCQMAPKAVR